MNCVLLHCWICNLLVNGLLISLLASILFVLLNRAYSICLFYRRYSYLNSRKSGEYNWKAYSFTEEDGGITEDDPNGSNANVRVNVCKMLIYITLRENNDRTWNGQLDMKSYGFGTLIYKYSDKHEYGHKDCYIGKNEDGDYIFITPVNRKILSIKGVENPTIEYDYNNEILIRKNNELNNE